VTQRIPNAPTNGVLAEEQNVYMTKNEYFIGFPHAECPGLSGVVIPEKHNEEIANLEKSHETRLWTVRAVLSDHVPLAGSIDEVLQRKWQHGLRLNENPLTIYIHRGGSDAVYFDLVGGVDNQLSHIELRVQTDLPDNALKLAWEPFNTLLDTIVRSYPMPLVISRLELLSPRTGEVIAYNLIFPNTSQLGMGPLGGFFSDPAFIPADAIWREALNSSSPFYRLLCAYRMKDATDDLRAWMQKSIKSRNLTITLPLETKVDKKLLIDFGMSEPEIRSIRNVSQLFDHFYTFRNAIAHFLIKPAKGSEQKIHVPISDGALIRSYSVASSALLHYAHERLETLRTFGRGANLTENLRGSILPMPDKKLDFPVRDPELTKARR
jgi:hypothetical protein